MRTVGTRNTGMPPWQTVAWPGFDATQPRDELRLFRQAYCAAIWVAAALQVMFFTGAPDNLLSTLLVLVSSLIGISYSLQTRRFRAYPISALIMFFYTTTSTSGALLVKTVEWSPVADRLTVPVLTFSVLFAGQVVLLAADHLYLRSRPLHAVRRFVTARVFQPLGLIRWPNETQLWMLGIIGCVTVMLTGTDYQSEASFGMASAGSKVIRGFGFLKFAPFLIPFRDALSGVPSRPRLPMLALGGYFFLLVGISFATNSRSTFADALPTIGICVMSATAFGLIDYRRIPPSRLLMFAVVAALGGVLLSRIALAMVVARDFRYNSDVSALISTTLEAFFNSEWLNAAKAKMDTSITIGNYSEDYVNSRFFGRFLLTKFHDNVLYYFSLMGPDHIASYKGFMLDRLLGTLPDPLLRPLGIAINKQDLVVSNGDYLVYIVDGWGLGGFKTGSTIGEVFGVFGWGFPLVLGACGLMLFVFYDAFVTPTAHGRLAMSPLIILMIWNLCGTTAAFGLGAESVTAIPAGIVRNLPQNVLLYAVAIAVVKYASRLIGRGS